jgi:prepilin-type processing-associated H-X9-DG protein
MMAIHVSRRDNPSRSLSGVTLLETVVVLALVGVLMALLVPAVLRVRDAAARTACASNLRQLAFGVHLYADAHGNLPQGCAYPALRDSRDYLSQAGFSWHTSILPYVEQDDLWQLAWAAYIEDPSARSPLHSAVEARTVSVFLCPSEARRTGGGNGAPCGLTCYEGVAGTGVDNRDGLFHRNFTIRFTDITDGTANTLMIGERPPGPQGEFGAWYTGWAHTVCQLSAILPAKTLNRWDPDHCSFIPGALRPGRIDDPCDLVHFWSLHLRGANFAFADGSVRFLPYSASAVLPALATRAGGEIVSGDAY